MVDRPVRLSDRFLRGAPGRVLLGALVAFALALAAPSLAAAQTGTITGRVVNRETGETLAGAQVRLLSGQTVLRTTTTGAAGEFRFADVQPGTYSLLVNNVGFSEQRLDGVAVAPGATAQRDVQLVTKVYRLDPLQVTAGRIPEKASEAPARVAVISRAQVEETPGTSAADHVKEVPGADVVQYGLAQHNVVARGFNNVFSGALMVFTDNRWASVPSLRFNAYNLIPVTNEDIEQIEFVLGPGSALYGPNADKGVMHIITRSPFDAQQGTISLIGGERELFQGTVRQSGLLSDQVGYKISAMYFRGRDWAFDDDVEQANRAAAIGAGADPDTLLIGRRDFDAERFVIDGRLDFRPDDETSVVLASGVNQAISTIEMTGIGAAQAQDWRYVYVQGRVRHKRFFAQSYVNFSNAGDTYLLRDGARIEDNSLLYVGQIQHGVDLADRHRLTYGADLIRTVPKTNGSIHGQFEDEDNITEVGAYGQWEVRVDPRLSFVAAARADYHDVIDEVVFSPRAGVVLQAAENQSLRLTYNRAFSQPSSVNLFLDLVSSPTLGGLPFAVRAAGARDGYTFRRDCGGLCMRSPFLSDDGDVPGTPMALDATRYWGMAVFLFQQATGIDLSAVPPPDGTQVLTVMRELDPFAGAFNTVTSVADVDPIEPTITNTFELGYTGLLGGRLFLGVDAYFTRAEDFIGPLLVETPNVFLERTSLQAYLEAVGFSQQDAAQIAAGMAGVDGQPAPLTGIPLATVTPANTPGDPEDLLLTYRNFGTVEIWGADLGLTLLATDEVTIGGTYSWVSDDFFANLGGIADLALNAPRNKATLTGSYRSERLGLGVELRGRYVDAFPVNSGVYVGRVNSYVLADANVTYALPFARSTQLSLSAQNLFSCAGPRGDKGCGFNERHQEIVGAPAIGRLLLFRLRQTF